MQRIASRTSTWLACTALCAGLATPALAHDGSGSAAPEVPTDPDEFVLTQDFASPTPSSANPLGVAIATTGGPYVVAGFPAAAEVHLYDRLTGDLVRTLHSPNPSPGSQFGAAVATSGMRVVVGAPGDDTAGTDAGAVYIFEAFTGALLRTFLNPTPEPGDGFGTALEWVGFLGDELVIGAPGDDTQGPNEGAAYVFQYQNLFYPQGGLSLSLFKPAPTGTSAFGSSVGRVGDQNTAVGDPLHPVGGHAAAGAVFVFDTTGFSPNYGQPLLYSPKLNPSPAANANFGAAIATATGFAGPFLVVGAPAVGGTAAGRVDVFIAAGGGFVRSIVSPATSPGDWFGRSITGIGPTIAIGAPREDTGATDSGAVHFFNASGFGGNFLGTFANPTPGAQDWFGYSVTRLGNAIAVGAPQDSTSGPMAGAAYVYLPAVPSCTVPGTPAEIGEWGELSSTPAVPTHVTVLGSQKVLYWFGQLWPAPTYVLDPVTGTSTTAGAAQNDIFCSGHTTLADGRVISIGGHTGLFDGIPDTYIHDPYAGTATRVADMAQARWYPTATTLRDGRILATAGHIAGGVQATIPEIYSVATNTWTPLTGAALQLPLYPFMFLLPNGKLFQAGAEGGGAATRTLDLTAQSWATVGNTVATHGSAAMYVPGKVLRSGGRNVANTVTVANAEVIDMTEATPAWRSVAPMAFPRQKHNLVLLPDGSALAVGGRTNNDIPLQSQLTAERFDPETETWSTMACMAEPRMYHSTAALLPDGRVMSAGGNLYPSYQIYSPPYLFKGPRPTIASVSPNWFYEVWFTMETQDAASIASVVLMRPASTTHGFDENQRLVPIAFEQLEWNVLKIWTPLTRDVAPPGEYLFFLVNDQGVPSLGTTIRLDGPEGCG